MIEGRDVVGAIGLQPAAAIKHLGDKGAQVTGAWSTWLDGEHARAFTVANVAKLDVVTDIQRSLEGALKDGKTFEQWKHELVPTLQRKGWWQEKTGGPGEISTEQLRQAGRLDEQTGEIRKGLTPHRLKTIFATNMQSAYMAGRHDEMMAQAKERPFWEYVAVLDSKTRPAHRAMHGRILRFDDPGWRTFYPPCGYRCRCRVRNHSERDVQRKRLKVDSTKGKLSEVEVPLAGGKVAKVTRYTDPSLPGGRFQPDAGFSNNPARSVWMPRLADKPRALTRSFVDEVVKGPQFQKFVQARGELAGEMPVGVLRDDLVDAAEDATVYLRDEKLAAGMGRSVPLARWRLVAELIQRGRVEQLDDGLHVAQLDQDGQLEARLRQVDGVWELTALAWLPRAAR